jgi:hypothetical protein
MKRIALLAFLGLLATGPATAQSEFSLSGQWDATNYRCNCGSMIQKPSIYHEGYTLTFTNPCGQSSAGEWVGPRTFRAVQWGVNATIVNRATIRWNDGCVWHREWSPGGGY